MFLTRSILMLVLCASMVTGVQAQMQMPDYLFPDAVAGGRQFPRLERAPDGTLVLSFAKKDGDMAKFYMTLSTDGGMTWTPERYFMDGPYGAFQLQRQTYAIMDNKRVLHGVGGRRNSMGMMATYYTRSEDLGLTWTAPKSIRTPDDMRHMDFASIAVDSSGIIYISYITNSRDTNDKYTHDFIARSTTNGVTWSPESRVDRFPLGGSCECCTQNIEIGPDGEIAIAFRSNINNRRDVHVARSNDGALSFSTPVNIQSAMWMIGGCPATGPSIKYDPAGTVHVTWRDARSQQQPGTCFYARLAKGATTTPINVNMTKDFSADAEYPALALSEDGLGVAIAWESPTGVFLATSLDGGITFDKDTIAVAANDYASASVVWSDNGPFALWQTRRGTTLDIASHTNAITGVIDDSDDADVPGEIITRTIFDVQGRVVHGTPSGVHFIVEHTTSGISRRIAFR